MNANSLPICKFNDHFFTVIHGLPFYLSTGTNSGKRGTWFPCFGMRDAVKHEEIWIIKPSRSGILHAMEKDETLYYVSPNVEINSIIWEEFPQTQKQSVLLLQWRNNILRARYLSSRNQEKSFVFGQNVSISLITCLSLDILFNEKRIVSRQQVKQWAKHDFFSPQESIHTFANRLFVLFYQHSYRDEHLADVSNFDSENCRLEERFINLTLFGISAQLYQSTPQNYMDNETMVFWESEKTRQLIASTPPIYFPQLNMNDYEIFDSCKEINQWLKENGGTVLPNNHPLDVFTKLRAATFWVSKQEKLGESPSKVISLLHSMGVQPDLTKKQIQQRLCKIKARTMLAQLGLFKLKEEVFTPVDSDNDRLSQINHLVEVN